MKKRSRLDSLKIDKEEIVNRIFDFYQNDTQDRVAEIDMRLQRYAKYRMWTERKTWPWPDATNCGIPDLMTASMRMQDTLHNAVMSQTPPIMAKASKKCDQAKEDTVNDLISYQVFEEQDGEDTIAQLAHDFVNEGFFTAYIPWVREERKVHSIRVYPGPQEGDNIPQGLQEILYGLFPQGQVTPAKGEWDYNVKAGEKKYTASFYTRDSGEIELLLQYDGTVYDGPRIIRKDLQQVLHPARCENLQQRGPSNPNGAPHVILVDYPSIDELKRLYKMGIYDLLSEEDAEKLNLLRMDETNQQREQQKDIMQGHSEQRDLPKGAESHKPLTRLMVFDSYDLDGDGLDEDVIFWMILEDKILLRACYLTQMFPSETGRRPFAEGQLFPVPGRRYGIGILELIEPLHDIIKQFIDQSGDAGTLANAPFGFYRATSSMKPEVLRMWPGELYPLSDPAADVNFPQFGNKDQTFMFNMVNLLGQYEDRASAIGDLQLGRVPQGKSSALRTVQGMQTVLAQGDARPERVLRRFFMGLSQVWEQIHLLNRTFLPPNKEYMMCDYVQGQDPYKMVETVNDIAGDFRFTFSANALNTSKEALQGALQTMMGAYISPLLMQWGLIGPDGAYRLFRDFGRALGQDPDKYLSLPMPGADKPKIFAEDAISAIMSVQVPQGEPIEGAEAHLQKLMDFKNSEEFGFLGMEAVEIFRAYASSVAQKAARERQQAALMQAAAEFQQGAQPQGQPGPQPGPQQPQSPTPVQAGELVDETLPGAGGGANLAMAA